MTAEGPAALGGDRLRRPPLRHDGHVSGGRLNPYKLGIELLRDIEHRWNTGQFGKEYDDCDDLDDKRAAGTSSWAWAGKKIFEVRRVHNDITFIDTFLTPEFCREHKLFSFAYAGADRATT